jgi:hypothetical protein
LPKAHPAQAAALILHHKKIGKGAMKNFELVLPIAEGTFLTVIFFQKEEAQWMLHIFVRRWKLLS